MSNAIPIFALGRHCTITLTPQQVSTAGVFSTAAGATSYSLDGRIDADSFDNQYVTDNISPTNALMSNPVVIENASAFTITEIATAFPLVASGHTGFGYGNVLASAWVAARYHLIDVSMLQDDLGTNVITWSAYVLMTNFKKSTPKAKGTYEGTFNTVLVLNSSTGQYLSNPSVTVG